VPHLRQAAYYTPNREIPEMIAAETLKNYQSLYPSAMKSFQDDWEACVVYMRCPKIHHTRRSVSVNEAFWKLVAAPR